MNYKLVMDSSANVYSFDGIDFASAPLKILAGDREFVDNDPAVVPEMVEFLKKYRGKSSTTCPNAGEFLEAFGDADRIFCITISSNLSGSYNAAMNAAEAYMEQYPDRKVHVFDSLSAGPEMLMAAEKIRELIQAGLSFDEIVAQTQTYLDSCHILFCLESMLNLANNGRIPMAVAKVAGVLGIRMVGWAENGFIKPTGKARGEKKVVPELMKLFATKNYKGGKVHIAHCNNLPMAEALKWGILEQFPGAEVSIGITTCLCSFYAEEGGLMIGIET